MRASLGLPPLKTETKLMKDEETKRASAKKLDEEKRVEELQERVAKTRRSRQQDALAKTEKLGREAEDIDDVMQWVEKTREQTRRASSKDEGAPARRAAKRRKQEVEPAEELENAKLNHSLEELEDDGEVILTLADKGLLDDKGNLIEEDDLVLENVLTREQKDRDKAFRASQKSKPLWEEDGVKRTMLDKYDEEEEEALVLGKGGTLPEGALKPKEDMKAKLLQAQSQLAAPPKNTGGDYYTPQEIEAMKKPKKKKERKLKKKALTSEDIGELEKAAEMDVGTNLGSREQRKQRLKNVEISREKQVASQRAKFDAALKKANIASEALRYDNPNLQQQEGNDDDDEDDGLAASLARVRDIALKKNQLRANGSGGVEGLAKNIIQRREHQSQHQPSLQSQDGGGLTFTTVGEFARSVVMEDKWLETKAFDHQQDDVIMEEVDADSTMEVEAGVDHSLSTKRKGRYRRHRPEDESERILDTDHTENQKDHSEPEDEVIGHEATLGVGLAGTLALLKERGELQQPVEWAGRTNDSRNSFFTKSMEGYKDVYTGGKTDDQIAADVEVALTKKDEFGRVLTPKEAFRQLSHSFHGIQPSQNTKEKRMKQIAKELAQKRAATGSTDGGVVTGLKAVQAKAATPYMVLSGTVKPGQTRDAGISKNL